MQINLISCFWGNDPLRYKNLLNFLDSYKELRGDLRLFFYFYSDLELPEVLKDCEQLILSRWDVRSEYIWQKELLFNQLVKKFAPKGVLSFIDSDVILDQSYVEKVEEKFESLVNGSIIQGFSSLEGAPSFAKAFCDKRVSFNNTGLNWILSKEIYDKVGGLDFFYEGSGDSLFASRVSGLTFSDFPDFIVKKSCPHDIDYLDYKFLREQNNTSHYSNRLIPYYFLEEKIDEIFQIEDGKVKLIDERYRELIVNKNFENLSLNCTRDFRYYFIRSPDSFIDFKFKTINYFDVSEGENRIDISFKSCTGGELGINILPYQLDELRDLYVDCDGEYSVRVFYSCLDDRSKKCNIPFSKSRFITLKELSSPSVGLFIQIKLDTNVSSIKLSLPRILGPSKI